MTTSFEMTCDCHAHIFGDHTRYPLASGADYLPATATADDYQQVLSSLGVERCVLVQPSVYGTDNSCMLDALTQLGPRARGVAVIASDTPLEQLQTMHGLGVRGVRLNTLAANGPTLQALACVEEQISSLQWHLQLLLRPETLPSAFEHIERLDGPVVLDHFASCSPATDADTLDALFDLVNRKKNVWIKLSAPYLFSDCSEPALRHYRTFTERAAELMPDRLLWGTDWPHTARQDASISTHQLQRLLLNWLRTSELREQITVHNPARLYGF